MRKKNWAADAAAHTTIAGAHLKIGLELKAGCPTKDSRWNLVQNCFQLGDSYLKENNTNLIWCQVSRQLLHASRIFLNSLSQYLTNIIGQHTLLFYAPYNDPHINACLLYTTCFVTFQDMPCMKRCYKGKKVSFHWSAIRNTLFKFRGRIWKRNM